MAKPKLTNIKNTLIGLTICLASLILLVFVSQFASAVATYKASDTQQMYEHGAGLISKPSHKSIELTWNHPTEREDGTPLTMQEISGYVIRYQHKEGSFRELSVSAVTSTVIKNAQQGLYKFQIATVDSDSLQGKFSPFIEVDMNAEAQP